MRSNNPIKVIMKIPFPISKPDRNGIIYTKEAIEKAVREFDGGTPLIMKIRMWNNGEINKNKWEIY